MKFIHSIIYIVLLGLVLACTHNHNEHDEHEHEHGHAEANVDEHGHEAHEHEDGEIHLTEEQIATMDIQFGTFSTIKINDFIRATGTLGLPPNALNSVNAKANGFIKNSNKYVEGSYVKKGVIMAYLEHSDFIVQQQEYLEIAAALVFDKQELDRQKELVAANAGIEKKVQQLQATINMKNASLKGIEKQLAYLGIKVANLTTENIVQRVPIYAPMSGYITSIKMHNGMYVTPERELLEIVSEKHLHLELDIFEQDIANIKEEQRVSYSVPALGTEVYEGEVHVIGKEFNTENKTVRIHGHLGKKRPKFIKDLFVEAKVWLNDQTVQALPEKAIIRDGASDYIYITDGKAEDNELKFEQRMVIAGTSDNGFTAVKLVDKLPEGMQIVTVGAYYVYAQSKAGELEHSH